MNVFTGGASNTATSVARNAMHPLIARVAPEEHPLTASSSTA